MEIIITEEMMVEADANKAISDKFMDRVTKLGKQNASFDELFAILDDIMEDHEF